MIDLYQRCQHWTVLQMVAIVFCYRGQVLSERAQGCIWSQLSLNCHGAKVIQITSVVLGDTYCKGSSCCIEDSDCTYNANANHRADAHRRCDNQQSCTVGVVYEKIPCGYWGVWYYNDFERITYNCTDDPHLSTYDISSSTVGQNNEVTDQNTSRYDKHDGAQEDLSENQFTLPFVMATVCLLLLIAIVIVVVMMKRKRWTKVDDTVQMTDLDGSNRKEVIYANEDQTLSQDRVNDSLIYSNHKIKKSRNKGKKSTKNDEVPSNAVYSLADDAGSRPTENPNIYCNTDSREPVYQVPRSRSNVYSLAKEVGESECAGSTADLCIVHNTVYCEVEIRKKDEATNSSAQNIYDEACNINESEYEAVKSDKSLSPTQKNQKKKKKKETDSLSHKTSQDSYTKVDKPSRNVATSDPSGKVESNDKVGTIDGHPYPIYEEMSPSIPQSMYANATVVSPNSSVTSRSIPTGGGGGSVTDNPYCEMK